MWSRSTLSTRNKIGVNNGRKFSSPHPRPHKRSSDNDKLALNPGESLDEPIQFRAMGASGGGLEKWEIRVAGSTGINRVQRSFLDSTASPANQLREGFEALYPKIVRVAMITTVLTLKCG